MYKRKLIKFDVKCNARLSKIQEYLSKTIISKAFCGKLKALKNVPEKISKTKFYKPNKISTKYNLI